MRALLDVNILIALLDANHIHHQLVSGWLEKHVSTGWASCPITQNGCIRIMSQPGYPNPVPASQVAARLAEATQHSSHQFWPDAISLLQPGCLKWDEVLSSRHVTDAYLLALTVQRKGRFVTLDRGVPLASVIGASATNLVVLS
jgi:toxin-antitoxin system PIN domain toxin